MPHVLHFLIFTAVGWLNRHQEDLIDYLREENRVLREQLGGRPLTPQAIAELVVRMAIGNPRWAYTRTRDALANLGHEIGRNTVKRILLSHGLALAPERGQCTPWKSVPPGALGRSGRDRSVPGLLLPSRGRVNVRPLKRTLRGWPRTNCLQ